ALHPGWGFLAENADFAQAVIDAGLVWVGPPPAAMRALGDKACARRQAAALGLPIVPGWDDDDGDDERLAAEAERIGWPLLVKASAGGGGRGLRRVERLADLAAALQAARREARAAFGDDRLVLERAVERPRHVEFQVFADAHGRVIHLGERDCSVQRRHQKLVEEAPCPALDAARRREIGAQAVALARAAGYVGAGTIEWLLAPDGRWHFIEANARLQVEHGVTEALVGVDLVEWQLRVAAGAPLPLAQDEALRRFESGGHAIEARLCAEDARHGDLPASGTLAAWRAPGGVRCDHALADGEHIAPHYDSLLAKPIAHGPTRDAARQRLARALDATLALGVPTNRSLLAAVLRHDAFARGDATTGFLDEHFSDRAATLPAPDGAVLALAALWLAAHAAADLPAAWAASALAGPPALTLRLGVGPGVEVWRVARERGALRVEGRGAAWRCTPPRWSVSGPLRVLDTELAAGDAAPRRRRLEALLVGDAGGARLVGRCDGVDLDLCDLGLAPPRRARAAGDGALHAPMHGRLLHLHAAIGEQVEQGQILAVLEAMKMEHALAAPLAGRVRAVHAVPGSQVGAAQLLVEIEPIRSEEPQ
ncbi:MAG TPA: biotin/lipoyl-containing protein, partial [Burkholderiaceae bacterium]